MLHKRLPKKVENCVDQRRDNFFINCPLCHIPLLSARQQVFHSKPYSFSFFPFPSPLPSFSSFIFPLIFHPFSLSLPFLLLSHSPFCWMAFHFIVALTPLTLRVRLVKLYKYRDFKFIRNISYLWGSITNGSSITRFLNYQRDFLSTSIDNPNPE